MQIVAEQNNVRQSSRKVRLVANQVKKLSLKEAVAQLAAMERHSSIVILKVIKQAVANATKNNGLAVDDLVLRDIAVADGMIMKRMRAVSRGRGHRIEKRTCHVRVVLENKQKETVAPAATEEGKK